MTLISSKAVGKFIGKSFDRGKLRRNKSLFVDLNYYLKFLKTFVMCFELIHKAWGRGGGFVK